MRKELLARSVRVGRERVRPLIVSGDMGSQHCGGLFQDTLKAYGMRSSMSRRDDCQDNAPIGSLWSSLKVARVHGDTSPCGMLQWMR
jgi:transposase InsO family protein